MEEGKGGRENIGVCVCVFVKNTKILQMAIRMDFFFL